MNKKEIEILEQFILDNKLTFEEGVRNLCSTIISGFCLATCPTTIGADLFDFLCDCSRDSLISEDFLTYPSDEFLGIFEYAEDHDYDKFWETDKAFKQYKFDAKLLS